MSTPGRRPTPGRPSGDKKTPKNTEKSARPARPARPEQAPKRSGAKNRRPESGSGPDAAPDWTVKPERTRAKPGRSGAPRDRPDGRAGKAEGKAARPDGKPSYPQRRERPKSRPPEATQVRHVGKRRPESFDPRRMKPDKGHIWIPGPNAKTIRSEAGQDLAHYLVAQTGSKLSVRKAREHLENACCRINGRIETFGSYTLLSGDVVEFLLPEEEHEHHFDERRILHNDRGVFAYDKPPHLAVTPQDGPKSWSLFDILKASPIGQETPLFPVHRLDADTSGIVLFAKDPGTATRLEAFFRDHQVEKTYHAIVRGHPREEGSHRSYLVKVASRKGFEQWKSGRGPDAREAITNWQVEERLGKYGSLVRVQPKTGRYHQIRIHFSELGYPLYGDRVYGDRLDPVHVHRHQLHASEVHLANPTSGPALRIRCPIPRDMLQAMDRLRRI